MEGPVRLAACEPCRQLKLACDHTKPVCSRCQRSARSDECVYRDRPFKKRRRNGVVQPQTQIPLPPREASHSQPPSSTPCSETTPTEHHYPNAGHLGFSSHATIFNRLPAEGSLPSTSPNQQILVTLDPVRLNQKSLNQQTRVLEEVFDTVDGKLFEALISFWLAKEIPVALGGRLLKTCTQTLCQLLTSKLFVGSSISAISQGITKNSAVVLNVSSITSIEDLAGEISNTKIRWETIALALIVGCRATADIPFFPPLYTSRDQLQSFQQSIADLADRCLEIALSLDNMNDVQLICQFESFILRAFIDGDQSYVAWRRLGDVISSLLFLGLNEKIEDSPTLPAFMAELRRTVFAQIYADDKNMAVFLGRPPRLNRKFCYFQLPSLRSTENVRSSDLGRLATDQSGSFFGPDDRIDQFTGLRWTACCASIKEEILEVLQDHNTSPDDYFRRFTEIQLQAEKLWHSLPPQLKLEQSLGTCQHLPYIARDFLLTVRLNYIQILFLIANAIVVRGRNVGDAEESQLLKISQEMLSLVVEAIVLREQLINSGTSLLWKVVHYGLPAAGAICLSMLRPIFWRADDETIAVPKILQDLGVFASEVQIGGLVQTGDANYALLHRATSTIQSLLRASLSSIGPIAELRRPEQMNMMVPPQNMQQDPNLAPLQLSSYTDIWGYEYDFWRDLSEHPSLMHQFL